MPSTILTGISVSRFVAGQPLPSFPPAGNGGTPTLSNDTSLASFTIDGNAVANGDYLGVLLGTESVTVVATAVSGATVTGITGDTGLTQGANNNVTATVTAEDGITTGSHTVRVGVGNVAFVSDGGDDIYGEVGNPGKPFRTTNAAITALEGFIAGGSPTIYFSSLDGGEGVMNIPFTIGTVGLRLQAQSPTTYGPDVILAADTPSNTSITLDYVSLGNLYLQSYTSGGKAILSGIHTESIGIIYGNGDNGADGASGVVDGSSFTGSNGANGNSGNPPDAGESGAGAITGASSGADGVAGINGKSIDIYRLYCTSVYVNAGSGGAGGNGGNSSGYTATGGNGGNGGDATGDDQNGGNGGDGGGASANGGNGGAGGNGGNGGIVTRIDDAIVLAFYASKGLGGNAGSGGSAGTAIPGTGGLGGNPTGLGTPGIPGNIGSIEANAGASGNAGADGVDGVLI